jgi:ligand-binding sensor protein
MDIRSDEETWTKLLAEVEAECGMTTTLYDLEGHVIRRSGDFANGLCRQVQAHASAVTTVCSVAQQNIGREAQLSKEPAIGECDLGMVKLVVPILQGDAVIGFIGACGSREPDVEVEAFLASRSLEVDEESLAGPVASVSVVTPEVLDRTVAAIQRALQALPVE